MTKHKFIWAGLAIGVPALVLALWKGWWCKFETKAIAEAEGKRAQKHSRRDCGKKRYGRGSQPDSTASSSLKI